MKKRFTAKNSCYVNEQTDPPDIVALFFSEIKDIPLLTATEEVELAIRVFWQVWEYFLLLACLCHSSIDQS